MADWIKAQTEPTERASFIEEQRARVEATIKETHDSMHRAMDRKYNLLRVSERRWTIVRVSSVAKMLIGEEDVITFEQVTKPLPFDEARAELQKRRAK